MSTDDWPFFYMPRRIFPATYLVLVVTVVVLSLILARSFVTEKPRYDQMPFFFLGAGFMLVETKGVTELGLTFGNTWQVIGVIIGSILVMAFLANSTVQWLNISHPFIAYLLLVLVLSAGWWFVRIGGFSSTWTGRFATAIMLTCPMFFSGIVFSTLLRSRGEVAGVMAMNLMGAMCGGLLEYSSMYFGFRFLYLLAIVLYVIAFAWDLVQVHVHCSTGSERISAQVEAGG